MQDSHLFYHYRAKIIVRLSSWLCGTVKAYETYQDFFKEEIDSKTGREEISIFNSGPDNLKVVGTVRDHPQREPAALKSSLSGTLI